MGCSPEEAAQAGYPGVLSTSMAFADGQAVVGLATAHDYTLVVGG